MANKDGLEPNKPVDFETLQRVKRAQREAIKNAKAESKGKGRRRTTRTEDVRETGEPSVSDVLPTAKAKGSKGS
jgi:hypothetical protein